MLPHVYFHVPVLLGCRQILRLPVYVRHFQFRVLPFGLATSPGVFETVLAPVGARLWIAAICPCLADGLLWASWLSRAPRALVFSAGVPAGAVWHTG